MWFYAVILFVYDKTNKTNKLTNIVGNYTILFVEMLRIFEVKGEKMDLAFEYVFPAIRGIQAKREYYVSMCPLRLIPRMFLFNEEELVPELRAQRTLNKNRLPELSRYIVSNRGNYVFSAITASVDAQMTFEPFGSAKDEKKVGLLKIPMSARFIINDGQHRRAAIEIALREQPDLADETIAVVLFQDIGLERCQQMFADLNRYAIRPSKSLGLLYDHRDEGAKLAKLIVLRSSIFKDVVEMEKTTLSPRSRKLFTLSAIYGATSTLLGNQDNGTFEDKTRIAGEFWEEVAKYFPEWQLVQDRKMTAGEVRRDFIHSHAITLHALGYVGYFLLKNHTTAWKTKLKFLQKIDWSRSNSKAWEGRAMVGGQLTIAGHNIMLTSNLIKTSLNLPLTQEEKRIESAYLKGKNEKRKKE